MAFKEPDPGLSGSSQPSFLGGIGCAMAIIIVIVALALGICGGGMQSQSSTERRNAVH
jgi:hypothetical protein